MTRVYSIIIISLIDTFMQNHAEVYSRQEKFMIVPLYIQSKATDSSLIRAVSSFS